MTALKLGSFVLIMVLYVLWKKKTEGLVKNRFPDQVYTYAKFIGPALLLMAMCALATTTIGRWFGNTIVAFPFNIVANLVNALPNVSGFEPNWLVLPTLVALTVVFVQDVADGKVDGPARGAAIAAPFVSIPATGTFAAFITTAVAWVGGLGPNVMTSLM